MRALPNRPGVDRSAKGLEQGCSGTSIVFTLVLFFLNTRNAVLRNQLSVLQTSSLQGGDGWCGEVPTHRIAKENL